MPMASRFPPLLCMGFHTILAGTLLLAAGPISTSAAQDTEGERAAGGLSQLAVTTHEIRTTNGPLRYTATTGYMPIPAATVPGGVRANVFFVAYTSEPSGGGPRPITFLFNGGPGQPAVWLHLGVGPHRAAVAQPSVTEPSGSSGATTSTAELLPNEHTWLSFSDLVFIDPVSTGYSRAAPGVDAREFHGYVQDVEYLGEFVRLFLTRFERWDAPKYLAGESYGTTRVSGLARYLQERHGIALNGVILLSAILNWQTARFHVGNDLPYLFFLPSYTATAWYHGRLDEGLQAGGLENAVQQAREFALGDYATALLQGDNLATAQRGRIVQRLAGLTGLSPDYVEGSNLRIEGRRFMKELRRDERLTVGRLDSRYVGVDRDAVGEVPEFDPSYFVYQAFTALFNDYIRGELEYRNDLAYEIRAGDLVRPWDYSNVENRYLNVAEDLRSAMSVNPGLRLFVACGYYDLATPLLAVEYTLSQMQLAESLRENVTVRYYEAGHMMYIHPASLEKLELDISSFYDTATGRMVPQETRSQLEHRGP